MSPDQLVHLVRLLHNIPFSDGVTVLVSATIIGAIRWLRSRRWTFQVSNEEEGINATFQASPPTSHAPLSKTPSSQQRLPKASKAVPRKELPSPDAPSSESGPDLTP